MPMLYLGVDVGGTNIAAGIVDSNNAVISRAKLKSRTGISSQEFCADVESAIHQALESAGCTLDDFSYCGIGCPGVINPHTGVWEYSSNLGISGMNLRDMMEQRLGLRVYVGNDADCAALGEVIAGAAAGARSALIITLGTGVGGGIIIDGKIYSGMNGNAGEIGHMVLFPGGKQCNCGRHGCWEAYCSATALKQQTRIAMENDPDSVMWSLAGSLDKVSGRTAFEAKRMGDAAGTFVVESYIYYLAEGIANLINILQPEVVCIGGGISGEGDNLLRPLNEQIERYRFTRGNVKQPRVVCASLGNSAGIIGAAMLGK